MSKFEMPTSPLQGYDQIVAVSQGHINMSLDAHFSDEKLLQLEMKNELGEITAHMLPPTVALVVPDEPAKTHFMLNLDSGTFIYYSPNGYLNVVHTTNWTLAFIVNLELNVIDNIPSEIAKKIAFQESYSVSQLLLDFSTPELISFNPDLSSTPGLLAESSDTLLKLVNTYLRDQVHAPSHNILGYAITVREPTEANEIAASFPPTSVRFQTMAHQPISPANDCILFLEMTDQQHPLPASRYIGWTSNWIEEDPLDPHHAGSMVLSKENFWDNFFVPHAEVLNRFALEMLRTIWILCVGENSEPFPGRDLDPHHVPDSKLGWTSNTGKSVTWSWYAEYYGQIGAPQITRQAHVTVDVDLDIAAKTIRTSSKFNLMVDDKIFGAGPNGENFHRNVNADVTWGFDFTLANVGVGDGRLGLSTEAKTPAVDVDTVLELGDKPDALDRDFEGEVRQAVEQRVRDVEPGLAEAMDKFNSQSQFVFPGSGTFFMKDPTLNESGDLVVGLTYKQ